MTARLWSLWDMLRFRAQAFVNLMEAFQGTRAVLRRNTRGSERFSEVELKRLRAILRATSEDADTLGATLTKAAVDRLRGRGLAALDQRQVLAALDSIHERLTDEMAAVHLFILDAEKQKYLGNDPLVFGEEVANKLPLALPDIADAGDCLAFKKGTAAVFHLMRVMEAALKALGGLLGIPYAPSWESYIKQIEAKISAKHKTKGVQWKRDEAYYREILGNLQTIKIAWRNPTMHIVRRYSVEEAEEIYVAVRAFLKRLAPNLPAPKS